MMRVMRAIAETVSDGIVTVSATSVISFANPAFETMLGYRGGALLGEPVAILLSASGRQGQRRRLGRLVHSGDPDAIGRVGEVRAVRRKFPIEVSRAVWESGRRAGRGGDHP